MLDVDHFKKINDRYGHLAGDRALVLVAGVLRETARKQDIVGRYGGDEFLLIGRARDAAEADALLVRLQQALAEACRAGRFACPLTLSAGYTLCGAADHPTLDSVLNTADKKMYAGKRQRSGAACAPADSVL